jgi:transcriptional regulator with XRE-family HTH domain
VNIGLLSVDAPAPCRPLAAAGFGERVRRLREEQQLPLAAVGARAGISTAHLWGIEKGNSTPGLRVAERLAAVLGSSLAELMPPPELQEQREK